MRRLELKRDSLTRLLKLIRTFLVWNMQYVSLLPVMRCTCGHSAIHDTDVIMFQKSFRENVVRSFGPRLRPLFQLEHLPLPPLDKTPPETQSATFLISDELWKQRAASKLCNRSHPLRGKSRVGLSCRRERAMTGLRMVGGWWPCIMDGAKYASAGGAEWRRWRARGWCQPIGCPWVMHFTLPPQKNSLLQLPHYCARLSTQHLPRP